MREDSFRSQSKISCVWIPVVIAKSFSLRYNSLPGTLELCFLKVSQLLCTSAKLTKLARFPNMGSKMNAFPNMGDSKTSKGDSLDCVV